MQKPLPPLNALRVFEAAARHLSFKNAAQELSVTPGAVSHQIKALEGELGVVLFLRQHRGVELTSEGQALFETLSSSFRQISRQLARVRKDNEADTVTVGSTTAVAALWLSPTIIEFWRDHPDINVHQVTQDRPIENTDDFDFFICYGRAKNPSLLHTPLYRDQLVPVAAPDVAAGLQGVSLEHLAKQRLIQQEGVSTTWTKWAEWFAQLEYHGEITSAARVTSYSVALQIARKGAGIALGWRRLVQPMINSGKLAVVSPYVVPAPHQFYLAGRSDEDLTANARILKQWLLDSSHRASD